MSRTFIRQVTQVRNSDDYDDTLAAGVTLETGQSTIEGDLNALRSQAKRAIFADAAGDWYADIPTVNGKKRAISALNTDLDDLEEKRFLFRSQILSDITVPAGQNFVVLSVSSSEAPSQAAAVSIGTAEGAVVALLAGDVGAHSLNEVSGADALSPKNLVLVRDAVTGQAIQSSGKDVYGLLQVEAGTVDGDAFNDTDHQVQISFVRENAAGNDLEAVPVVDIENKIINYAYVRRIKFDNIPEQAFLSGVFLDQVNTGTDVTLNNAIDNQVGPATQTDRDIDWRISDTFKFRFQTSDGLRDLFAVLPSGGGDEIELNIDTLDVNNVNPADFAEGIQVDSSGTLLRLGVVAGQLDSAGALTLKSQALGNLLLDAAGEIEFLDGNKGGSTFGGQLLLSDTSLEWSDYEIQFGEVSLLRAIVKAKTDRAFDKRVAVVTAAVVAANTNVTGSGGTPNLDATLLDYTGKVFVDEVNVFLNGVLLRNGADSLANHDVYPGDSVATGDIKFEFVVKLNDVVTMEVF